MGVISHKEAYFADAGSILAVIAGHNQWRLLWEVWAYPSGALRTAEDPSRRPAPYWQSEEDLRKELFKTFISLLLMSGQAVQNKWLREGGDN